ncbi:MAG TPA: signal recognition particle-docking protein FtsY [Gammaproteobacteria bacterium]|nr:signal recognition particle-docking protein FtsY [Gammaproteobacteria bacterium]
MGLFDKFSRQPQPAAGEQPAKAPSSWARGLAKTRAILTADVMDLMRGRLTLDESVLEELETRLLLADAGIEATEIILSKLREAFTLGVVGSSAALMARLKQIMLELLGPDPSVVLSPQRPHSILIVGVNGSGKTTTLAKLAQRYRDSGHSVLLAAGDTFRAAAIDQLKVWAERSGVPVVAQGPGADPAAVVYDGLQAARTRGLDVLIADTAGRLHTQSGLMDELKKIKRVMQKLDADAPRQTLLVIDAGIGQNALQQARQFHEAVGVTGLILTKMDGTAKGGIVFAIRQQLKLPVLYVGTGEGIEDLQVFSAKSFVDALLD